LTGNVQRDVCSVKDATPDVAVIFGEGHDDDFEAVTIVLFKQARAKERTRMSAEVGRDVGDLEALRSSCG
jgi:hypothetical protein